MHASHVSRIDFNSELEQEQSRDSLMLITEQYPRSAGDLIPRMDVIRNWSVQLKSDSR